jgi:hypothetical protein
VRYDDGRIVCTDSELVIGWYYLWGAKRIPYARIRSVDQRRVARWRIWGSGDFVHWWNLDRRRPTKETALVLDVGGRIRPTITPDDPDAVAQVLAAHGVPISVT